MKRLLCGVAMVVGLTALASAQTEQVRVVTRPALPSREVLDRLNLDVAWRTKIKFQNNRDGIFSVQLLPGKAGLDLLVQTLHGAAMLFDSETGDLKWRMALEGKVLAEGGSNNQSVFVARGPQLYVLNRKTGMHRVYSTQEGYPDPIMGFRLPATPSAPLVADDAGLFVAMGQRISAYIHPDFERALEEAIKARDKRLEGSDPNVEKKPLELEKLKPAELEYLKESVEKVRANAAKGTVETSKGTSLQPVELWSYYTSAPAIQQAPLATYNQVIVVTSAGNFLCLNRFESFLRFEFKTHGAVSAPMGQYGLTAYVGSDDYTLYALDMHSDRIVWRFMAGAPIYLKPAVTDQDVYVTADRIGMYRVDRASGQAIWLNQRAEQFVSTNAKFVYALDRKGNLLILDALRGTTMAVWDAREWTIGLSNEWNDRSYFAAQDGQLMCVRHRDQLAPHKNRTFFMFRREDAKKPETKTEEMEKKEEEKKEEKKIDKEKVKEDEKKVDKEKVKEKAKEIDKEKVKEDEKKVDKEKVKEKAKEIDKEKVKEDEKKIDKEKVKEKAKEIDKEKVKEDEKKIDKEKVKEKAKEIDKEKEKVGRALVNEIVVCDARWERRAVECGGTSPLWMLDDSHNPKRRRAAALHIEPWLLS